MTPLQYRALIRLQEARRRLLLHEASAREIGFDVGYDSQMQFTREYRKMFGRPPATDAAFLNGR
ncbi:helix-turn-helix domain-containing protein [Rhizobium calliandrae]|uniref:Helix-turn-helix domain-containing protein n=2 Tax=Rhizobium calliandrae TaxID=1312182 RepID=A0ABT7KGH5_9HYPH|nr:helix-turn-helix domain-containing protein [Rhizobium calliandrae]MDL2407120.1 helix-turn-helix domain-containing protein [Rhizobium calliandrae]